MNQTTLCDSAALACDDKRHSGCSHQQFEFTYERKLVPDKVATEHITIRRPLSLCMVQGCSKTAVYEPYCTEHARELLGLCVKESCIGAGNGLFATKPFTKGQVREHMHVLMSISLPSSTLNATPQQSILAISNPPTLPLHETHWHTFYTPQVISVYTGETYSREELDRRYPDDDAFAPYVLETTAHENENGQYTDAAVFRCIMAMANHAEFPANNFEQLPIPTYWSSASGMSTTSLARTRKRRHQVPVANATLEYDKTLQCLCGVAVKDINEDEEIFVNYGSQWDGGVGVAHETRVVCLCCEQGGPCLAQE
jgi:hypothetical protein